MKEKRIIILHINKKTTFAITKSKLYVNFYNSIQ